MNETTKTKMPQGKRERQVSDDLEGDDDSVDDEDYKPSDSNDECKRSYTTRRNTKIPEGKISFLKLNKSTTSLLGCQTVV